MEMAIYLNEQPFIACLWENTIAWAIRVKSAFLCTSHRDPGPSQGEIHIVLFIQYQRCLRLNLNKEGHWTELSVWLPFRTAVNAFLLIQLLKASPCKKSMWGEYNAGGSDTTKGHCIKKPYLCCVTFGNAGEVGSIPVDTQSASVKWTE